MRVTFTYDGQPKVTLVVHIPKLRNKEITPQTIGQVRFDMEAILAAVPLNVQARADSFATELFRTVKKTRQDLTLTDIIFTIDQGDGETSLCYSQNDVVV